MKVSLPCLVLVPFLCAAALLADGVAFAPAEDTTLTKRFRFEVDLEMDDLSVMVNGQDIGEMLQLEEDMAASMSIDAAVTDTYEKVGGGRPLALVRAYDELVFAYEANGESDETHQDDVEGSQVRFTWNEDDETYDRAFVDEDEEGNLDVLHEDMDLRALLPEGEVDEGDSWEVDPERVLDVLLPGTDPVSLLTAADIPEEGRGFAQAIAEGFGEIGEETTLVCTYRGTRDVDGVEAAIIAVELEGSLGIDLISALSAMELPADADIESATLELQFEGEGELLWNMAAGHLLSFELNADVEIEFDGSVNADVEGNSISAEGQVYFSGEAKWSAGLE